MAANSLAFIISACNVFKAVGMPSTKSCGTEMKGKVYAFKIIVAEYCLLQCKFHSYLDYESLKNFVALRTSSKHRPVFICSVCYGILGLLLGCTQEKCGKMKARIIEFCYDPVSFNSSQMNEDAIEVYAGNSLSICSFMLFNHSRSFHSFSYPFELFVFCVPDWWTTYVHEQ